MLIEPKITATIFHLLIDKFMSKILLFLSPNSHQCIDEFLITTWNNFRLFFLINLLA